MIRVKHIVLVALLSFQFAAFSQSREEVIQQRVEFISEQLEDESVDLTDVIVQLNYFYDKPLNLNAA